MDGLELNLKVAEAIGWTEIESNNPYSHTWQLKGVMPDTVPSKFTGYKPKHVIPNYSEDIKAAWELTRHIPRFNISRLDSGKWKILLTLKGEAAPDIKALISRAGKDLLKMKVIEGDSAPEVICLAVLECVRIILTHNNSDIPDTENL